MRRYLFVCGKNRLRSPTAEHLFSSVPGIETLSAGINRDADEPLTDELVVWADIIFVMERTHRKKVQTKHRAALGDKRVVVLGIPDDYTFMEPALVALLRAKMRPWLPDA
ncbi:MAG: phosphotyrosine protein phosphatase [Porphyrobacter sp.]|nr:phosphotyrosine protein phosphatase [Porphyrobacter sp.]